MTCERCNALTDQIKSIEEMIKIQSSNGNWNYDPYMHGMANGMILIHSILTDQTLDFLTAPNEWLRDIPERHRLVEDVER